MIGKIVHIIYCPTEMDGSTKNKKPIEVWGLISEESDHCLYLHQSHQMNDKEEVFSDGDFIIEIPKMDILLAEEYGKPKKIKEYYDTKVH